MSPKRKPTPTFDPTPTPNPIAHTSNSAQNTSADAQTQPDNAQQTQGDNPGDAQPVGNIPVAVLDAPEPTSEPRTHVAYAVAKRLQKEGRWADVEPIRDQMMRDAKGQGMDKASAQAWVYSELDRLYPPLDLPEPAPDAPEQPVEPAGEVAGVYLVPDAWPPLPNNASLQAEVAWVQGERLRVVEIRGNRTEVHLERASIPAPSMAALSWLETSIRSYAKYVDVVARALSTQQDEQEHVRRERMRIDDIRALLDEMHRDG